MVLYKAAKDREEVVVQDSRIVSPTGTSILRVQGRVMAGFAHSVQSRSILNMSVGQDVVYYTRRISYDQIKTHRPAFINAILIQSRGERAQRPCNHCSKPRGKRPFPECRRVEGHFGGACGNCKWSDKAIYCSLQNKSSAACGQGSLGLVRASQVTHLGGGGRGDGTAASPILIDEDGSSAEHAIVLY